MVFSYLYIDLKYGTYSGIWSSPFLRERVNTEKQILAASQLMELPGNRIVILCTSEDLKALGKY